MVKVQFNISKQMISSWP